jgi:hypothetical protein
VFNRLVTGRHSAQTTRLGARGARTTAMANASLVSVRPWPIFGRLGLFHSRL